MRHRSRNILLSLTAAAACASGAAAAQGGVKYSGQAEGFAEDNPRGRLYAELAAKCEAQGLVPTGFVVTDYVHDGYGMYQVWTGEITCVRR